MVATKKRKGAPLKVLVVDPNEPDLEATSGALREAGCKVVCLSRVEAAVSLFGVFQPDAVVIATGGPDYAAVQVARRLRQLAHGTLPIYYLLAAGTVPGPAPGQRAGLEDGVRYCLERGWAVDVSAKPVGAELALKIRSQVALSDNVVRKTQAHADGRVPGLHDPLTEVFTRRYFLAVTTQEMRRCERHGGDFSVAVCQLNGLAQFKKEFGREMADRLLVYFSVVLTQSVREADVVARAGEDTFALLLPGMAAEKVPVLVHRLTSRFDRARFQVEGKVLRTSMSFGAISFPDVVGTSAQLLARALEELRKGHSRATAMVPVPRSPVNRLVI